MDLRHDRVPAFVRYSIKGIEGRNTFSGGAIVTLKRFRTRVSFRPKIFKIGMLKLQQVEAKTDLRREAMGEEILRLTRELYAVQTPSDHILPTTRIHLDS